MGQTITLTHDMADLKFVDLEVYQNVSSPAFHGRTTNTKRVVRASKASLKRGESFEFTLGDPRDPTFCMARLKHPTLPVKSRQLIWHKERLNYVWGRGRSYTYHVKECADPCVHNAQKAFQYFNQSKTAFNVFLQHGNHFLEKIKAKEVSYESLPVVIIPTEEEQKQRKKPRVFTYKQLKDGASKIDNATRVFYDVLLPESDKTNADIAAWGLQAFERTTANIERDGTKKIVQERGIMIIHGGKPIDSTATEVTKWAKTVQVLSACSKLIGAAVPLVEFALALLKPPPPSKKDLGENELRKIVYEETSKALHDVTWSEFKKTAQGTMEAYRDAIYFVNDPEEFKMMMEKAKSEGSDARRHISNYRVNKDKMYAQVILYAEVATIELLALTFLSQFSENYRKILADNIKEFKAELSKIHEDAETGTKSFFKDALKKCKCAWEGEEHFVLDKNHDADKLVKNFCELWDQLVI